MQNYFQFIADTITETSYLVSKPVLSLKKERMSVKKPRVVTPTAVLSLGYTLKTGWSTKKRFTYIRKRIASRIVMPLLQDNMEEIIKMFHPSIQVEYKIADDIKKTLSGCGDVYHLKIYEKKEIVFDGYACTELKEKYHFGTIRSNKASIINMALFFAELLLFTEVKRYLESLSSTDEEDDIPYQCIKNDADFRLYVLKKGTFRFDNTIPEKRKSFMLSFLGANESQNVKSTTIYNQDIILMSLMVKKPLLGNCILPVKNGYCDYFYCISETFISIACECLLDEREEKYEKDNAKRARSFQTKKNIPKKILLAMQKSRFNEVFGEVEFDQDTDLDKMKEIENNFFYLNKILFHENDLKSYALRFRKLGNHNAAGLYYPTEKCMCIDLDAPNSFVHEFMHLLDNKYGRLSRKHSFYNVRECYTKLLENTEECKYLKGKYNLKYYLTPTEIFARCGEIYVHRIKHIENSSLVSSEGFAYPEDAELENKIKEYFDNFFEEDSIC